jgi:D-amino-acid dehydrogenase
MADEGWDVAFARQGKLVLCPDAATLRAQAAQVALQARLGCRQEVLGPEECVQREPALAHRHGPLAGGIWTADECVVDPFLLCAAMADALRRRGGRFVADCEVQGFERRGEDVVALRTNLGPMPADAFVLAAGPQSAALAAGLGLRLPIYPVKGYSISLPFRGTERPSVSVTDLGSKTVFAPLGPQLRVAAMAEIVGDDLTITPGNVGRMLASVEQTYPGLCEEADPRPWAGLRPATPDSVPLIGRWRDSNLYLNVGHGALGLTLAAGSAMRLTRAIAPQAARAHMHRHQVSTGRPLA